MSTSEGGGIGRRTSGGSHLERMASLVDYSSSDESEGDAWHPNPGDPHHHHTNAGDDRFDEVPRTSASASPNPPRSHPFPPFAARMERSGSPMDVGSPPRSPAQTHAHASNEGIPPVGTMSFNLGSHSSTSPLGPSPSGSGSHRRRPTATSAARSPTGSLGASSASRLASRRAANRRAATGGAANPSSSTSFSTVPSFGTPSMDTPDSPPPFDFFSPNGVETTTAGGGSGGRRRRGSAAVGFPPASPSPIPSPNTNPLPNPMPSPNTNPSPNPMPMPNTNPMPSPNANANASFASDVSSGTPLGGTFAMGASTPSSNRRTSRPAGTKSAKSAPAERTFEFTPPPPPPFAAATPVPGSAPPPVTMPDIPSFAGFNLGSSRSPAKGGGGKSRSNSRSNSNRQTASNRRSNAGDSSRSPKTKPAPVVDASPPSSPDVGSASPNPADYGADRGPIRRAQRPRNNNSPAGSNNNADNRNDSRPRVNVRWESTLPRHTTDPAMDVLRERTAAMNLGGSRGRRDNKNATPTNPASRAKEEGNEHFRSGRYAAAMASYTRAIESMRLSSGCEVDTISGTVMGGRDAAVCYANRAATRLMAAGDVTGVKNNEKKTVDTSWEETRAALADCRAALRADAGFDRARLRAGTCLVRLGAFAAAEAEFNALLSGGGGNDNGNKSAEARELASETARARRTIRSLRLETLPVLRANATRGAAEGAASARRFESVTKSVTNDGGQTKDSQTDVRRLAERTAKVVSPLRTLSPHCAVVAEAYARAQLCVGAFTEAIRAANEDGLGGVGDQAEADADSNIGGEINNSFVEGGGSLESGWRIAVRALAHFARGDPARCVETLTSSSSSFALDGDRSGDLADVELATLAALRRVAAAQDSAKKRGNQSFKAGRFDDAEKHYTAAIDAGFEPRTAGLSSEDDVHSIAPASVHFAAVCLCNRAAAAQGGGKLLDALADCGRALALNPAHGKSLLRRAQVHASLRLVDDAADDLRALVRLLTARGDSGDNPSGGGSNSGSIVKAHSARLADAGAGVDVDAHLADARARLAQNGAHGNRTPDPPDHYAALGLIRPDAPDHGQRVSAIEAGDVRRAYRSLALRHHPDKSVNALSFVNSSLAFQSVLNSAGGDGLIAHTSEALRSDADRIFKLLGEANACLSDPRSRGGYDADERTRRMRRAVNAHGGGSGGRGFEPGSGRRSSSSSSAGGGHYHYQSRGTGGGGRGHSSRGGGINSNNSNNSNRGGGRGSGSRAGGGSRRWDGFGASYGF